MLSLYRKIERAFWFTLTRKIVGNVVAMMLPLTIMLLGTVYLLQQMQNRALEIGVAEQLSPLLNSLWWLLGISAVLGLAIAIFTICFMRAIFVKPIRDITQVLQAIKEKDGDISATLPDYTFDEIS